MSSAAIIDALFLKTVDIIQSLPKTGPIQTSYEEKLVLYSLYKQSTEGDVSSKRPGMLDMLGRAKWDAWSKLGGVGMRDAKQMYVESMLRILRRFGDRPQASVLIHELESFSGQVANSVMHASFSRRGVSDDGSTSGSEMSVGSRDEKQSRDTFLAPPVASVTGTATVDAPHLLRRRGPPSLPGGYSRSAYATSSAGGRSVTNRTTPGVVSSQPSRLNTGANQTQSKRQMEKALQSIQASLAALHERMHRVETLTSSSSSSGPTARRLGVSGSGQMRVYRAIADVVSDVKQLFGMDVVGGRGGEMLAPSFVAEGGVGWGGRVLMSAVRVVVVLVNLVARVALDGMSLLLVTTLVLYAFKRITGRGDPLLMLRLLNTVQHALLRTRSPRKPLVSTPHA